jgi:hypothetical protein
VKTNAGCVRTTTRIRSVLPCEQFGACLHKTLYPSRQKSRRCPHYVAARNAGVQRHQGNVCHLILENSSTTISSSIQTPSHSVCKAPQACPSPHNMTATCCTSPASHNMSFFESTQKLCQAQSLSVAPRAYHQQLQVPAGRIMRRTYTTLMHMSACSLLTTRHAATPTFYRALWHADARCSKSPDSVTSCKIHSIFRSACTTLVENHKLGYIHRCTPTTLSACWMHLPLPKVCDFSA